MNENKKLMSGIKSKLLAAVCMLLVAVIMVVSSTYAWFTLSTAPEVTGITTAVGANGALEMLLLTHDGTDFVYNDDIVTDGATKQERNTYWGNLVDVSSGYGLDLINLYPSKFAPTSTATSSTFENGAGVLSIPVYNADGRVDKVEANGMIATYDKETASFKLASGMAGHGIRAIGVASGLTDKQLTYRNALAAANTATSAAKDLAAGSLNANGNALANIAVAQAMDRNHTETEVQDLIDMFETLDEEVIPQIEMAYMQYLLAYSASSEVAGDVIYVAVKSAVNNNTTLEETIDALANLDEFETPTHIETQITNLNTMKTEVSSAINELSNLTPNSENLYDNSAVQDALTNVLNVSNVKICGFAPNEVKANLNSILTAVTGTGVVVTMEPDSGIYEDIADHCGDYQASVVISNISYGDIKLENVPAKMVTKSDIAASSSYLSTYRTTVLNKEPTSEGTDKPISEFYGYIVDLAFRTNAAESNLLLQGDGIDRIYQDNGTSQEQTLGHGSTMSFKSLTSTFTTDQIKNLMKSIRIVFFTPYDGTVDSKNVIIANAALNIDNAIVDGDGNVIAEMYIDKEYTVTDGENNAKVYKGFDGKYYTDSTYENEYIPTTANAKYTPNKEYNVITALTQNTITNISVMVYLDGETVTNAHVAATVAQSMVGTMNLQFASSATLVPMEYADLHPVAAKSEDLNIAIGGESTIGSEYIAKTGYEYSLSGDNAITFDKETGKISVSATAAEGDEATLTIKDDTGKVIIKYNITVESASSGS